MVITIGKWPVQGHRFRPYFHLPIIVLVILELSTVLRQSGHGPFYDNGITDLSWL